MSPTGSDLTSAVEQVAVDAGSYGLTRVGRETLQDKTYTQLRMALIGGQIPSGQVMTVRALAQLLGTSTTPVREAIGRLVTMGALELLANGSVRVPILTRERFEDITTARLLLECRAAELAAQNIRPEELQHLDELADEMRRTIADAGRFSRFLAVNEVFHFTVYHASRLQTLSQLIESLWLQVGPYLTALQGMPCTVGRANAHHGTILHALKKADAAAARKAVEDDINNVAVQIVAWLSAAKG